MQVNLLTKCFGSSFAALLAGVLLASAAFAQTVTVDSAPPLTLRNQLDGSGLALSSVSVDPMTGNVQVNTTSNVTSWSSSPPIGRTVTVTSPNQATPNSSITVSWVASGGFNLAATTCSLSLGAGSAVPVGGFTFSGQPPTSNLTVVLGSAQPASYSFSVQCVDAGGSASNSSITNVVNSVGCSDPDIGKWRGVALSPPGLVRDWVPTFGGQPFPGPPNAQFTQSLSLGGYDSMRFTVPMTAIVGQRYDLINFVSTASAEGVLAASVSPCLGDFRESILSNNVTRKACIGLGGGGGTSISVVIDAGPGPYNADTCEVVRGRTYFFNTTFGTASSVSTGNVSNGAYCVSSECIYKLERRLARSQAED